MEKKLTRADVREILGDKRFNMSGYDDKDGRGSCVVNNQEVLNTFASYGIYEYTEYLYLDFYKGSGTIYFKYWNEQLDKDDTFWGIQLGGEHDEHTIYVGRRYEGLSGLTTSEIIVKILELTIYSGKPKRRTN